MFASMQNGKAAFEFLYFRSVESAPFAATQGAEQPPFFRRTKDRPAWEEPGADRFAPEQCEFGCHEVSGQRVTRLSRVPQAVDHINAAAGGRPDANALAEPKPQIETKGRGVEHAHPQVRARRTATAEPRHQLFEHAPAVAAALRARQQVDVQMRRIGIVRLGTEIVRVMIPFVDLLDPRPPGWITLRAGELGAQRRAPLPFVASVKGA